MPNGPIDRQRYLLPSFVKLYALERTTVKKFFMGEIFKQPSIKRRRFSCTVKPFHQLCSFLAKCIKSRNLKHSSPLTRLSIWVRRCCCSKLQNH
ncbi:hypothetical protein AC1031_022096 [Aphanomyces cochlioides]|nr:hypothetical protein AC1031_022096 [Aphanomyces cochlioides]